MKRLKLFFACLLMAVLSIGQVWAKEGDVVYTLNTASTTIATSNSYANYADATNGWKITLGSKQTNTPTGLWLGSNSGQKTKMKLSNGSYSEASAIATAIGADADDTYYSAIIGTNALANVGKVTLTYGGTGGKAIEGGWILYSTDNGTSWTIAKQLSTFNSAGTDFEFDATIASARYAFVMYCSAWGSLKAPVLTFYEGATGGNPTCATPSFSPAAGAVVSGTQVSISCSTDEATIHYTTNGNTPTASSPTYTSAISVTSDMTIKAIAVKDGMDNSSVATAEYTIATPYTTIKGLYDDKTTTEQSVYVTFGDWKVSAIKGGQAYVTDGTNGLIIYQSGHDFAIGDNLAGTVPCTLVAYNGAAELKNVTRTTTGLTVTSGTITPVVKTVEEANALTSLNIGSLIKLEGVTYNGSALVDEYSNTITPSNNLFSGLSLENGKKYDVTGVFQIYNSVNQIYPRSATDVVEVVEASAPATPTFSVAAGEYTEVKSVELSCATDGATIYYTTDGSTPDNTSTEYTAAITVDASMTIKAIAFKDELYSATATAAYVINLPVSEEDQKTWNLAIDETATASENELTWTATYVSMSFAKGTSTTNANNYYPGTPNQTYTSTRAYKNGVITITPNGKQITTVVFTATTSGYATALKNSAWTNASATASDVTVTVTPTNGKNAISAVIGGTCGFTSVQVNYEAISATAPADPTFSVAAGEYTEVKSVELSCETDGATIYYTTDGSTPDNTSTEYTAAITVDENMTIKAIAYLGEEASGVAEAAYVINLPVSEEDQKTWDLTKNEMASASADKLTWTATYVDMSITAGTSTDANNYCPPDHEETRVYTGATLTISPKGKQITTIVFETNGSTPFKNATWTNGAFSNDGNTVTITASTPGNVEAVFGANTRIYSVQVNYGPIDPSFPVAPTFSVEGGTYTSAQSVELSCATVGATIYYTTDGTAPSSTSTEYTSAIPVNEDMTIKAVAINGEKVGPVVTQVYKINLPLTTMDAILTRATAIGGTAEEVNIQFNNWVVSGVGTDEKTVYVTDGSKGFIIYGSDHGFAVNDKISGTVACNLKLYSKVAEVVDLKSNATGLTVTNDGVVNVASIALAELGAVNTGALIALNNMKYDGTYLTDGTTSIKPYNSLYADAAFVENHYYNVTGIYVHHNTTKEIAPRSAADIEELQATAPAMQWYVSSTKEETIGASHIIRVGDTFAPFFETNSNGSLTFTSSDPTIAEIDENTGALTLKNVVGSTTITCAVAADVDQNLLADSKYFTLQVKAQPTVDNVVIVAFVNDKWYALQNVAGTTSGSLLGVEVNYSENKIWDLPAAEQAAITWKRTVDGADVTFQDGSNNYLKGTTGGAALTLDANVYNWNWYADGGYYRIGESARTFFVNYVANDDENIFKNFATSNLNKTNYSGLAVVTAAVFDVTPEPPVENYTEVRNELTEGWYYTMCLDKAVTAVKAGSIWKVLSKAANGNDVILEEAELPLAAGRPYIFRAAASTLEVTYTGDAVDDPVNDEDNNGLVGSFSETEIAQSPNNFIIYNNALYYVNSEKVYVGAHRAYLNMNGVPDYDSNSMQGNAPRRRVVMTVHGEQNATGMENVQGDNVQCTKVLINGQLFILRGEKMYDAKGQLVK